jgi:hypothetical protein
MPYGRTKWAKCNSVVSLERVVLNNADPEIKRFLESPGVLEQYKAGSDAEAGKADQISPLMKQAEAFALRIQPPQPIKPISPARAAPRPTKVAVKFSLLGTAVYLFNPVRSLALIDEPGKGPHWVRQSDNVGHLTIDQINDGHILVRDGERTEILYAKHPEKKSLLKNPPPAGPQREFKPMADPSMTKPFDPRKMPPRSKSMRQRQRTTTDPNAAKQLQTPKKQHESMDIGPEEAKDLEHIGTLLKAMEDELLRMERESQGTETAPAANEPNRQ